MIAAVPSPWVLIIDDEPEIAEEMAELCEDAGFPAVSVGTLDSALDILEKHRTIGAIASDLLMPGHHRGELMAALVAMVAKLDRPCTLMIVTGLAGDAEREQAASLSISPGHFFSKPLETGAFLAALNGIARAQRGRFPAATRATI
jgi:CheY-like chemotaxis protein